MNFIDKHCPYCDKKTNTEDINNSLFESSNAYLEILKKNTQAVILFPSMNLLKKI